MADHLVIMAGGSGNRLWPLSSPQKPKQFADLLGSGKPLLRLTYERFAPLFDSGNVWVVCSASHADLVGELLPEVPRGNILRETVARNTAPCVAYASWKIKSIDPKAVIVVTPCDHTVGDVEELLSVTRRCLQFARESDSMVTMGMKPTRPDTGYGYIEADLSEQVARHKGIYRVDSFHEKPDAETAQTYVAGVNYFWNAGIFVWSVSTIVNALRIYASPISSRFERLLPVYGTPGEQAAVDEAYGACESISIDRAVMEKADEIFCCPASFGWSDLGTWASLLEHSERDSMGNSVKGEVSLRHTRNCIIRLSPTAGKTVVEGLDGYVVAEQGGQLLICRLSEANDVGKP